MEIHLVCRFDDLREAEKEKLGEYENLSVYDMPDLHAKCYANGQGVVLTSLNLYDASSKNYEMGVYFDAEEDAALYEEAMVEVRHILDHAKPVSVSGKIQRAKKLGASRSTSRRPKSQDALRKAEGPCVRCGTRMDCDPKKPICNFRHGRSALLCR